MKVYQIYVKGVTDCLDDAFKCSSKKVYLDKPSESDVNEFISNCSKGSIFNLDINQKYETFIVELELIDNRKI